MMYDDAHADWGHRDNILRESHRAVSIGIASNGRRVTFVQHFEGGAALAHGPPELSSDNVLSFSMDKVEGDVQVGGVVSVYYDPLPTPKTPEQIDRLRELLHRRRLHDVLRRPCRSHPGAAREPVTATQTLTPTKWWPFRGLIRTTTSHSKPTLGGLMQSCPGVYTVTVWRDTGGGWLGEVLVESIGVCQVAGNAYLPLNEDSLGVQNVSQGITEEGEAEYSKAQGYAREDGEPGRYLEIFACALLKHAPPRWVRGEARPGPRS